jgi:hypothetical protein
MTTESTVEVQQAILDHLSVPAANSAFAQRVLADNDQRPDEKGKHQSDSLQAPPDWLWIGNDYGPDHMFVREPREEVEAPAPSRTRLGGEPGAP